MIRTALSKSSRPLSSLLQRRALHSSRYLQAASFFNMPAMSPTMEQGGIVKWHFKEGDAFKAGDSLLEVETDKATIDVEVQDDGILVKVIQQEGAKDVVVGKPIAIVAEPGDDLSSLELPKIEEEPAAAASTKAPEPQPELKKEEPAALEPSTQSSSSTSSSVGGKANPAQKFFPSVELLLEENNISREDALSKIQASAPNGKITKGDVLAYLGKISQDSVNSITSYIETHKHLDLSNIQVKAPEESKPTESSSSSSSSKDSSKPLKPEPVKIAKTFVFSQPISEEHLSQIVSRASKLSEQYSYSSSLYQPSDLVDPLFEDIISPLANTERFKVSVKINEPVNAGKQAGGDIFDYLTGSQPRIVSVTTGAAVPSVDVELTLNDKVVDSKQRAELFITKFGELVSIPIEKKPLVEEFEF